MSKKNHPKERIRFVWADIEKKDLKNFRKVVEKAISDPDYSIIANYEIHWDEIELKKNPTARILWADISGPEIENLRKQVDMALVDPDFSVITNYEVHWEEI
jgi:hypothetical protein